MRPLDEVTIAGRHYLSVPIWGIGVGRPCVYCYRIESSEVISIGVFKMGKVINLPYEYVDKMPLTIPKQWMNNQRRNP